MWRRTQTINDTKIKYIKIDGTDKLYKVEKISFYDFSIKAVETDLKVGDVAENEVFPIENFKEFRVTLKNRNMDNVVELPKKWNANSQHVRVDYIDFVNETALSIEDSRTENSAVYHVPNIGCTYIYLACKSVYVCWCRILGWGDFEGDLGLVVSVEVSVECTLIIEYLLMVGDFMGDSFDQWIEWW